MDELDQLLQSVPANKREAVRQHWETERAAGTSFADWAQAVRAKYPSAPTAGAQPTVPTDASSVALRTMAANIPASLSAEDVLAPRIALPRAPGAAVTGLLHAGNALIPFADEVAAVLTTGNVSGPEYETARKLAEYRIGSSANAHPVAAGVGTGVGAGLLAGVLPAASPEVLAGQGTGRFLGRTIAEGTGLGALYGAGASDPGDRLAGAIRGGAEGGLASTILGGLGAASGASRGTKAGRMALGVAEAGDADIGASLARFREAHPDSPLMAADLLGPIGPSRVRAASAVPGPGQRITADAFPARTAGRPERAKEFFRTALGTGNVNPYTAAEAQLTTRQQEAEVLYEAALAPNGRPVVLPQDQTAPLLKIPRIRQLIEEYRAISNETAPDAAARGGVMRHAPGLEKITAPELHYVKRRLGELGEGAEPGGTARVQAQAAAVNRPMVADPNAPLHRGEPDIKTPSIQGRVRSILERYVPGYREANAAYATRSGLMEAGDLGDQFLQMNPDLLEHNLSTYTPEQIRTAQTRMPGSVAKAVESGGAQTAMARLGIGPGARLSRSRAMDLMVPESVRPGFNQLAADEQLMIPAEAAQRITSPTEPTRQSIGEAALGGLSFGEGGAIRRLLLRSLHGGPNPSALAEDARMLTTGGSNRAGLERLLTEAVDARQGRGQNRLLGLGVSRGMSAGAPTVQRTAEVQDRATATDLADRAREYYDDLIATGATEERARDLTRSRFGL